MSSPTTETNELIAARRGRRWWPIPAAAAIVVIAAGATTALVTTRHYTESAPLSCACEVAWASPDDRFARDVEDEFGAPSRSQVPARPGHTQTFYVLLINQSSVTQTVLGLRSSNVTSERIDLAVARDGGSPSANDSEPSTRRFVSGPTNIPPGGVRWVRMSNHTAPRSGDFSMIFTDLYLRVRVGPVTRTETISLEGGSPTIHWG